jgi:hypothetical protein
VQEIKACIGESCEEAELVVDEEEERREERRPRRPKPDPAALGCFFYPAAPRFDPQKKKCNKKVPSGCQGRECDILYYFCFEYLYAETPI